jgi:hypothetical protein
MIIKRRSTMRHFKDQYYYLKDIRSILNDALADTTIAPSNIRKDSHPILSYEERVTISDLKKWSEYKLKRLVEEDGLL